MLGRSDGSDLQPSDPGRAVPGPRSQRDGEPRLAALRKQINDLQQAEANLMAQLEAFTPTGDDEIDNEWRTRLQHRFIDVVKTRRTKMDELAKLRPSRRPRRSTPHLIDQLPEIDFDLGQLPEAQQRRLFDAFQLELRYNKINHQLTIRATVRGDMVDPLRTAVRQVIEIAESTSNEKTARPSTGRTVSHVQGAPAGLPSK